MNDGEQIAGLEALLEEVEALPDPNAREKCMETIGALLDLYGEGLARIVEAASEPDRLADDELVSHLLLVHGLHPVPLESRVRGALEEVRPYLESHGGNVELVGIGDGVVRLALEGSCDGCPSSAATLELAIEDAIRKAAPEVEEIAQVPSAGKPADGSVAGLPMAVPAANPAAGGSALIQLEPVAPRSNGTSAWATAGVLPQLRGGGTLLKEVAGEAVLFCEVDGTPYAYRPSCPACGRSLEAAELNGGQLRCDGCGHSYEVTRAGRCIAAPELHLDPVPLLVDDGGLARVALA
jgi:Fe-S cluster biogenesis protein NfuA/nitrite reductase/ring-hydroxylating ferredoxin subunit